MARSAHLTGSEYTCISHPLMNAKSRLRRIPVVLLLLTLGHLLVGAECLAQQTGTSPPLPDAPAPKAAPSKNFFARWADYYRQDWAGTAAASPSPPRRGLPSPLDSPPFPNSDWSYGGSPVIGEPDSNSYPLMTAINGATSRTKIYGWIDPTLNFSTSSNSNAPEANDVYSNRFEMNQFVLYAERLPDSVQRDHIDWGYHLTALYGADYRYTTGKGYLSGQWLNDHHQYGFDPTLEYVDHLHSAGGAGNESASGPIHFRSGNRGTTGAEQLHLQPLAALCDRSVYRYRADRDCKAQRSVAGATRNYRMATTLRCGLPMQSLREPPA